MPKNYPGFVIDRSRNSRHSNATDDFIVCTDKEVGFVARISKMNYTQIEVYNERLLTMSERDRELRFYAYKIANSNVACVLEVLDFFYPPVADIPKLRSLMKKAMKSYLFGEVNTVSGDGSNIDRQIEVVAEMRRLCIAQKESLIINDGETGGYDKMIESLSGACESLEMLKQFLSHVGKSEN